MAGLHYRLDWSVLDSYFQYQELSASPATPEANNLRLYAKDSGGISTLCYTNDAGAEVCFPTVAGTVVTGTGVATRLAFWNGVSNLTSDADLTFATDTLSATKIVASTSVVTGLGLIGTVSTEPYTGYLGQGNRDLEISSSTGASTDTPYASLLMSKNLTGTDSLLAALLFVNQSVGGSDRRIAQMSALTDGATNSGRLQFHTSNAGALVERFRIGKVGQFGIGGATYGAASDVFTSAGSAAPPVWAAPVTQTSALLSTTHTDTAASAVSRGSIIYGNSTPAWAELDVGASAGTFLRTDATDVMWSTLILPNAITANRIVYASATNTYGASANLTYDGTNAVLAGGFLGIGTTPVFPLDITKTQADTVGHPTVNIQATITGTASDKSGLTVQPNHTPTASIALARGMFVFPIFNPAVATTMTDARVMEFTGTTGSTGAITTLTGLTIGSPSFGTTKPASVYGSHVVNQGTSGVTTAVGSKIELPTGATNNYVFELPADATDPTGGGGAATGRIPVLIGGTLRYLAYY